MTKSPISITKKKKKCLKSSSPWETTYNIFSVNFFFFFLYKYLVNPYLNTNLQKDRKIKYRNNNRKLKW